MNNSSAANALLSLVDRLGGTCSINVGCVVSLYIAGASEAYIWQSKPGHQIGISVRCDNVSAAVEIVAKLAAHQPYPTAVYRDVVYRKCCQLTDAWDATVYNAIVASDSVDLPAVAAFLESQGRFDATLRARHGPSGGIGWLTSASDEAIPAGVPSEKQQQNQAQPTRGWFELLVQGWRRRCRVEANETAAAAAAVRARLPVSMSICVNPDGSSGLITEERRW